MQRYRVPPSLRATCSVPTAKMEAWSGLMMAVNSVTPNIPRLEMLGGNSGRKKRKVTQ